MNDSRTLFIRDQQVIELLRQDLEDLGPGVTRAQVGTAGGTRWPDRVIRRLRRQGWIIDEQRDTYRLYREPTRAPDAVSPPAGTSGAPVGAGEPRLFDPVREAA